MTGSLVVVGTGIGAAQLTTEARAAIAGAETTFFLVGDPLSQDAVLQLSPDARSLEGCYEPGRPRREAYERMVETILRGGPETDFLKAGDRVMVVMRDDRNHPIFGTIDQQVVGL